MAIASAHSAVDHHRALFEEFERASRAPARLRDVRREAIERFAEAGFPTQRIEEWRYTSVAPIEKIPFRLAPPASPPAASLDPFEFAGADAPRARIVCVNGRFAPGLSRLDGLPRGVRVGSLAEAPERARAHDRTPFASLNTAFLDDGAVVVVPDGARVDGAIHVVHAAAAGAQTIVAHPRTIVVLGAGSGATVVETYAGLDGAEAVYLTNAVTEVVVGDGADLHHVRIQREAPGAFHVALQEVRVGRGARLSSYNLVFGAALQRLDVHGLLGGEGSDTHLNGVLVGAGRQHFDTSMLVEHAAPRCSSREVYKGVLADRAASVFQGKIHVHPGAQKTDAKQTNRNLLLSREASATSKPQLEIYADDVKCTHGATTGRLEADGLFYLRSRGIDRDAAQGLLVYAFAAEILGEVRLESVRRAAHRLLLERLPGGVRLLEAGALA